MYINQERTCIGFSNAPIRLRISIGSKPCMPKYEANDNKFLQPADVCAKKPSLSERRSRHGHKYSQCAGSNPVVINFAKKC